ncbi:MAG: hypothetical protein JSU96_13370 [Acidobacteriota bacterium]|nr:MAG: hypothetical protein JSU96_13370 [Acidobacteriota bacterium]
MRTTSRQISFALTLIVIALLGTTLGQDAVREELFRDATAAIGEAREVQANLLSPKHFGEGEKLFVKAQDRFDKGDKLDQIRKDLAKAIEEFKLAAQAAKLGQVALKDLLDLRSEVLDSRLKMQGSKEFNEAEKKFQQAAEKVEKEDVKGSRGPAKDAAKQYRKAVITVLLRDVIPDARKKLKDSKRTLTKAQYQQAESSLKQIEKDVKSQSKVEFSVAELSSKIISRIDALF